MSKFSICPNTGFRICEVYECLLAREDGFVLNTNPHKQNYYKDKGWFKGVLDRDGYYKVHIPILQKNERLARIIAKAFCPNVENNPLVDHIDGCRSNDNASNLRWVSYRENSSNKIEHRDGHLTGTTRNRHSNNWASQIWYNGKQLHLGTFKTVEEAHERYLQAIKEHNLH